jgi:hypothetical protein
MRIRNEKLIHKVTRKVTKIDFSSWMPNSFYPLKSAKRVADFGDERHYYYKDKEHEISLSYHLGYDLASLREAPLYSSNSGKVVFASYNGIYGKLPIIDHGFGLYTLYGHCSELLVEKGDDVDISKYKEIDNLCKDKTHFTIEELAKVISLIALQEDINYPRNKKRKDGSYYEGRKMPFYRFAEAIYCSHKDDHIIREVINRATIKKSTSSKKWENVNPNFYEEIDKRVKDQI